MSEQQGIFKAILSIMDEIGAISKDKTNKQQGFKFRGIDDVYNAIHPLLSKYRIFSTSEILDKESAERPTKAGGLLFYEKYTMKYYFHTEDGSSVSTQVVGIGMDSGDKAGNKAMAIAHKYAIIQMFCIPTQDNNDPDQETPPPIKPKQQTPPAEKKPMPQTNGRPSLDSKPSLEWLRTYIGEIIMVIVDDDKKKAGEMLSGFGYSNRKEIKTFDQAEKVINLLGAKWNPDYDFDAFIVTGELHKVDDKLPF